MVHVLTKLIFRFSIPCFTNKVLFEFKCMFKNDVNEKWVVPVNMCKYICVYLHLSCWSVSLWYSNPPESSSSPKSIPTEPKSTKSWKKNEKNRTLPTVFWFVDCFWLRNIRSSAQLKPYFTCKLHNKCALPGSFLGICLP